MNIVFQLLVNIKLLTLENWHIDRASNRLILTVVSTQSINRCPVCACPSGRTHSRYQRTVADLPWALFNVLVRLKVRKFFCDNGCCERRIFTERLPDLVTPWARRTNRLTERLTAIGLALGGAAGARLSQRLGIGVCRNTLLALIRCAPRPAEKTPRILGVDDFAFRKRHTYGTILIDQEKGRPVALLEDREANTLAQWLQARPGVEMITRDRSKTYAEGARQGAPDAMQVADRFHLLQNLAETLTAVFASQSQAIEAINEANCALPVISEEDLEAVTIPPPPTTANVQSRAKRRARFEQVWDLHRQGWNQPAIARHLGIGRRTVSRYLRFETFPERQPRSDRGRSVLNPYKTYIRERWNAGCRNTARLYHELKSRGYRGSYGTVAGYTRRFRQVQRASLKQTASSLLPNVAEPQQPPLTAYSATWLVMHRPDQRDAKQAQQLAQLGPAGAFEQKVTVLNPR